MNQPASSALYPAALTALNSSLHLTAEQNLETASALLLKPCGLRMKDLQKGLNTICRRDVDDADLYFECTRGESWGLEEGIVKSGAFSIEQGVGVRAVSGERTAFAYSDELSAKAIGEAARTVRGIADAGESRKVRLRAADAGSQPPVLYSAADPILAMDSAQKVALLEKAEELARAADSRVQQVMASLAASHSVVLVARADGHLAADIRPLVRLSVTVVMEEKQAVDGGSAAVRREIGNAGGGGRLGLDYFDDALVEEYVNQAVENARINLQAQPAPAGQMTVVLGSGWPGVLLHEAVGHGLEGDFNRKGSSAFADMMGQRVAAKGVTVLDDGTLPGRRGSLTVDDEGTPGARNVLIEDGILCGYLQDRLNARLMGVPATGNGRRESYAHLPMPRMTNTYMLAGDRDPQEIIASIDKGLYATNFGGGQVDITSGKFVFSASVAYWVENGRIQYPVKGATIIGAGPESLKHITMIGNDLELDSGVGVCGKDGQSVPVGVGQPTMRIEGLTVGGTC